MNVVDIIQWARDLALRLNVPGKLLRSVKDVEDMVRSSSKPRPSKRSSRWRQQKGMADKAQGEGAQAQQEAQQPEQVAA
jgi:hypothetical protein